MGIKGSGAGGRKTREDVQTYLAGKLPAKQEVAPAGNNTGKEDIGPEIKDPQKQVISSEQIYGGGPSTVEEMDRMRKLIADHMVYSQQVAPHVNSFVESDVTELVQWRSRVKDNFQEKYNQKLTITTLILEAVIKALKEQPRINVSVDGYKIIRKHHINLGMAAAQPDGNLIVPVIHNADSLNLAGLAGKVNDLAERARMNRLLPAEIQGGTFTVTNMGQFGNIAGTPIINQPQVAILAIGAIVKKPAVVETPEGDTIGIRQILVLSLAYDHRVVDGALGGMFLKSIGDHLQGFNPDRDI
jgi:2-oxoglutarate dehydrogenase E2 component (dihydrolipoamide succinyltransferase)